MAGIRRKFAGNFSLCPITHNGVENSPYFIINRDTDLCIFTHNQNILSFIIQSFLHLSNDNNDWHAF